MSLSHAHTGLFTKDIKGVKHLKVKGFLDSNGGDQLRDGGGLQQTAPRRQEASKEGIHSVVKPVLVVATLISVLPVEGTLSNNPSSLRFRWWSLKVPLSLVLICYSTFLSFLGALQIFNSGVTFRTSRDFIFYASATSLMILLLRLALHWKDLVIAWTNLEKSMGLSYPKWIRIQIQLLTAGIMSLAVCEHLLANSESFFHNTSCKETDRLEVFYINAFKQVFTVTSYSTWKGVTLSVANFFITLAWNFTDLLISVISIALGSVFTHLNKILSRVTRKNMPHVFWRDVREHYVCLAELTRLVDKRLSLVIFISFGNNLYFICYQLLNSLKPKRSLTTTLYFYTSFGLLLLRTSIVCLSAANIYIYSKEPAHVLYSVPSQSYNVEVRRFLFQVVNDSLALTGCKFFALTRTLILTVAGTIITYEIVLVQFNALNSDNATDITATLICPYKKGYYQVHLKT